MPLLPVARSSFRMRMSCYKCVDSGATRGLDALTIDKDLPHEILCVAVHGCSRFDKMFICR